MHRAQNVPNQLSYPTQGLSGSQNFGQWPVQYEGVPCPVAGHSIAFHFLDYSAPVRQIHCF